ncbi:hypothetical protein [Paenibacillus popilliae]|uniref:Uncharacterized protein conserved in bacteria n=1 Tax=Paenibacillus popilliae ATCC 14706 TaxID=1212764 RepID=M9LCC4_PAEPP|nr:hypothetical protein [Paenibacillus popilliae]GAC43692.1 uncharacterized protein conserved in bacteria [Paenibacillus popilliae ATCC 14706]
MSLFILLCFMTVFICRLFFLGISKKNEKQLLQSGGKEYGIGNTKLLTIAHIIFYIGSITEAWIRKASFDWISFFGILVLIISLLMLTIVVKQLGNLWTIKLIIEQNHTYHQQG